MSKALMFVGYVLFSLFVMVLAGLGWLAFSKTPIVEGGQ